MLFNREVIEQGRQAIKKWEGICYRGCPDGGQEDCAYCLEYHSNACWDCPIAFFSGEYQCRNTPYWSFNNCSNPDSVAGEKSKELALDMLNYVKEIFIKSLLLLDLKS